jgi:hypothetical protein
MKFIIRVEKKDNEEFIKRIIVSFKSYHSLNEELENIIKSIGWDKKEISIVVEGFGDKKFDTLDEWLGHKN